MTMARRYDRRGLAVTVANQPALDRFDNAVDAVLGHRADCSERIADALAADPGFLLAHCLKGFAAKLTARQEFAADAAAFLADARAAARSRGVTRREETYVDALAAWCAGDMLRAGDLLSAQLGRDPLDLLAIKLHQSVHFMLGQRRVMLDTLRHAITAWDATVPGFGYVLGCLAFALEESGAYASAERQGRRACALIPADIWAAHAVAHVHEMRGEPHAGLRWLAQQSAALRGCNNLAFHIAWHRALFYLSLDQPERAIALYDGAVRASETEDYRDIANAVSLLWRLEQRGVAVGARWRELADKAALRLGDPSLVFASLHHLLALVGDGRDTAAETLLRSLHLQARRRPGTQSAVLEAIGIALAEAVLAAQRRHYSRVVDLLYPIRHRIALIGGSNAQRDIVAQLLIDAAIAAGRRSEARILLDERADLRLRCNWGATRAALLADDARSAAL